MIERAAAMGRNNKKKSKVDNNISFVAAGKSSVENFTYSSKSPKLCITTSNNKNIKVIDDNHSRTIDDKVNTKCLRDIMGIKKEFSDQRSLYHTRSYCRKDLDNRKIHWDSVKSLVESNARCFEC